MASLMDFESTDDVASNVTESSKSRDDNGDDITCPVLKISQDNSCYVGKYCPLSHGKTARYNPELDVYYTSAFDPKHAGISSPQVAYQDQLPTTVSILQSSQQHDHQQIFWINGQLIIGQEALVVNYFEDSQYIKKSRVGRNERLRMQQKKKSTKNEIKRKEHLAKYLPKSDASDAAYKCSEKCINCEFLTAEMFAKHYVQVHEYPLIYYEQPMRIKFIKTMKYHSQEQILLHRCVIRFSFEADQFFLLEYFETGAEETSAVIYEFTEKQESNYGYEIQALDSNLNQGKKECLPISAMHSKNKIPCSFISETKSSEFFLRIYSRTKDVKYDYTQLIPRPGCELCASNHNATSDCANKFVIHKNLPAFNDKQKAQQLQEFCQREKKLKTHRQNNLTWNTMNESSLKFLPIVFLIPTKNLFNCDGVQTFVKNKSFEVDTREKKLIRMLEEEEEKNKLLERENEDCRFKIDKLQRQIEYQQQSSPLNHPYKKIKSSHVNSQFKPVIKNDPPGDELWAKHLNTFCQSNSWKKTPVYNQSLLGSWQCHFTLSKGGKIVTGETSTCQTKKCAMHCAAKLVLTKMGEAS